MSDVLSLPEVTRFIVQVPTAYFNDSERLRQQLCEMFPDRFFRVERSFDTESVRVVLKPVMEDDRGRAHICRALDRNLLSKMYEVMNGFMPALTKPA